MAKAKTKVTKEVVKRSKISQTDFPVQTLEESLTIAQAISDHFAGKSAAPHQIAHALNKSPASSDWRYATGSSIAYGLTEGGYGATQIALTILGKRIVAPTREGDTAAARAEAVLQPRIFREFFNRYDRNKFPRDDIAKNVLVEMGIPRDRVDGALATLKANGEFSGIIKSMKTGPFVALDGPVIPAHDTNYEADEQTIEPGDDGGPAAHEGSVASAEPIFPAAKPSSVMPKQLFVAHGKNRKPLDDLKKILDQFKIPFKVAIDEPNKGRPISGKVAELMNECSAGIFIFTKDEQFFRQNSKGEHDEIWRPSENVVYELGAANILWDRKIIIVREDGVNFPSDFSDLGYITFKDGEIASKALEILKELVALELVKFSAA
jgi:hypothetical protein